MKRTSFVTGIVFPALLAVAPGCGDERRCIGVQFECGGICIDPMTSAEHCGACDSPCSGGELCTAGECTAPCAAPAMLCGGTCVDTTTSTAHCGMCERACSALGECVAGACQEPLAVVQTSMLDGTAARDLYLLEDRSFALAKLNGPSFASGTVVDHALLPDGDVLMVAAQDTDGVTELYRVSPRTGARTKLNPPLVAGGDVLPGLVVSADGRRVLYRADQQTNDVIDLHAVELARPGVSVRVNAPLMPGAEVSRVFAISADGRRIAYIADQDQVDLDEAYFVDLSGAAPVRAKLNPDNGNAVYDLQMTPAGDKVVYRASFFRPSLFVVDTATPGTSELVVNSDGGEGYVEGYQLAADGSAVFYTSATGFLQESLWRAPLAAPPYDSTLLVDGTTDGGVRPDFVVTPDGGRVYYRRTAGSYDRLFRVDVAPPHAATRLSLEADDPAAEVTDFRLAPDGRALAFRGGADGAEGGFIIPGTDPPRSIDDRLAPTLHFVDLSAAAPGAPVLLAPAVQKGHEGIGGGYAVTDDRRVLFRADFDQATFSDLYLADAATAGTIRKVSPPLDQTTDATDVSKVTPY